MDTSVDPTRLTHRAADLLEQGLSRKQLRGAGWERSDHGLLRPAGVGLDDLSSRISDAVALNGSTRAIGGWAALYLQGNTWFDGRASDGTIRPVLIHCGSATQIRKRASVQPCRAGLLEPEVVWLDDRWVTTMARAAYDEMRLARSVREAVVIADMAASRVVGGARTTLRAIESVVGSHVKTRGIVRAREGLVLASDRSASPWETRTRLLATIDAGLDGLAVNRPIFDLNGELLGVADLLDEQRGLVIESDGSHHREALAHADDNRREESFERAGLVVCRITAVDHGDRWASVGRIRAAALDASRVTTRRWTTDEPTWWRSWPGSARWR